MIIVKSFKTVKSKLLISSILLGSIVLPNAVLASPEDILEQIDNYQPTNHQAQVTSVSQLRDVSPTDWAFEALRSLVERYGCIVGYPDRTFRGNRALSRYEFAAGLNACMQQMERLIAASESVMREDIEKLKRLMAEFESELATLGARVDNLEGRVAFLEDHQFSTTTKLSGEVIFGLASIFNGQKNGGRESIEQVPVLGNRTRIELSTSFTGQDLLYTRLATGNFPDFSVPANTQQASLAFSQPDDNDVAIEVLNYNFPISENITLWLEGAGGAFDDFTNTLSILDGDGGSGAISSFGTRNLVYYQGEGAGLALEGKLGQFGWSLGYLATDGNNPERGNGLFNGAYGILGQVGYYPNDNFGIAFAYGQGYNTFGIGENTRSFAELIADSPIDTSHNTYAVTMSWQLAEKFVLGAWGGYSNVRTLNSFSDGIVNVSRGSSDSWYWAATLGFPDLFKEGSLGGIVVGMQPWQTNSTIRNNGVKLSNDDTSFHIEAFYEYAITDNIKITPGVMVVTNPSNDSRNDPLVIGALRTTFTF
ncbi:iron uptake porin [Geminocystis herdmanii]|uniref:iron uptake porin n=1 Tax=Geminocystis herdmanii TaxID=669359 RepID=UPI000381A946